MNRTLAAATAAALIGVAGAANAADVYSGGSLKDVPEIVPPPATWTGFYLGSHVGGAWGELKNNVSGTATVKEWAPARCPKDDKKELVLESSKKCGHWEDVPHKYSDSWKNTNDGVFGGGTVGYNLQAGGLGAGGFVLGFEADFGAIAFSNTSHHHGYDSGYDYWNKQEASFYADVTGRLGLAFGPTLIYAKGGWAFLEHPGSFGYGDHSYKDDSLDGWTVGGGIEYLFSPNWSVKAEYLFFDFGKNTHDGSGDLYNKDYTHIIGSWTDRYCDELTINTVKVGINYHPGGGYTPLK